MPPGTISAWIPGGGEVPNRWQICDGSEIEMGPWKGKKTPDLTHAFLVGGAKENVDVGSDGPIQRFPPDYPPVVHAKLEENQREEFCSLYTSPQQGFSCTKYSNLVTYNPKIDVSNLYDETDAPYDPTYEVVYIMRVR